MGLHLESLTAIDITALQFHKALKRHTMPLPAWTCFSGNMPSVFQVKPSVVVVEGNALISEGLAQVTRKAAGDSTIVSCATFDDGVNAARIGRVDLILVDVGATPAGPIHAVKVLKEAAPNTRIIFIAANAANRDLLQSIALGAHGAILQDSALDDIARAIREVLSGRIYVPAEIHEAFAGVQLHSGAPNYSRLSLRQLQVARELSGGKSTKQIARNLKLSEGTVKLHLSAVFRFLGCSNRAEAVAILVRHPITG